MRFSLLFILLFIFLSACKDHQQKVSLVKSAETVAHLTPVYAKGFDIVHTESGYFVDVLNPWQGAKDIKYKYFFSEAKAASVIENTDEIIEVPVSRVICLSTTHIAFIDLLDETQSIVGVSGLSYVSNVDVRNGIEHDLVKDVGFEQNISYEVILGLKPQVVLSYGVGAEAAGYLQKLKDLKIPVVFIADYLEDSPLAKAEWVKLFGVMFGKHKQAVDKFLSIESEYIKTQKLVDEVASKPNVFLNLPWNDVWYFPGSDGYMARLIADAGGHYLLDELKGNQSHPFNIEPALQRGMKADIWLNTGSYESLSQINSVFPRLKILPVLSSGKVFNNNNRVNEFGGNDFWESGVVNPHIILRDLVKIFHPDSIDHELFYYKQLN